MNGVVGMLLSNNNTADVAEGLGFIKGANCTISDITEVKDEDGNVIANNITFEWTGTNGTVQHQTITVKNGTNGSGTGDDPEITEGQINDICSL